MSSNPPMVAIVGKKKSGKTTVLVKIAAELSARGWRVATIKHSHGFTMDHEGRDTWRHRHEGHALRTVIASENEFAVLGEWPKAQPLDPVDLAQRFLSDADLVLVEGYHADQLPTIEVYQAARHAQLWYSATTSQQYLAIAADQPIDAVSCPVRTGSR
jgi:molybdopterin-guanine dinucleotide biosynthesis protein B